MAADNEWGIGSSADFPFQTMGENGGSSRSLQRRLHLYGYFSGAAFVSEEWGMCNTFYDWQDFELSPYGKVKKEFLDLTDAYPVPGEKLAPVAVVLPAGVDVLEVLQLLRPDQKRFGYPVDAAAGAKLLHIRKQLQSLFANAGPMAGTETTSLINSPVPDAIDLIHADAANLADYQYLADPFGTAVPPVYRDRVIPVADAAACALRALPVTVTGNVHWMVNALPDGSHYLIVFNHSGVVRTVAGGEQLLPEAAQSAAVTLKNGGGLKQLEGGAVLQGQKGSYTLIVDPGDWFLGIF